MKNEHFLAFLKENGVHMDLPSQIRFCMREKTLEMFLSEESITGNMQSDAAAFESWAIAVFWQTIYTPRLLKK